MVTVNSQTPDGTGVSRSRFWLLGSLLLLAAAVAAAQTTYEVLHAFRASGKPSSLIRSRDGDLYGATCWGGLNGTGSIFKVDSNNRLITLHSFPPYMGAGGPESFVTLMQASDGQFYGTTNRGGANNAGTIFKMDSSGSVVTLHSFASGVDGIWPYTPLLEAADGYFYGTTSQSGPTGGATVFKVDSAGNLYVVHSFDWWAWGPLVQAPDGAFYGTTTSQPGWGVDTVYQMNPDGEVTTLHTFNGSDGSWPGTGVIRTSAGDLFGTTRGGGSSGKGTIFRIDSSGTFSSLHSFAGSDGVSPGALVQGTDGNLYGTTTAGGTYNRGTIYRISPAGSFTSLHSFSSNEGLHPVAALVANANGTFHGITESGGAGGVGVVFTMDDVGSVATILSFENLGEDSGGGLSKFVEGSDGYLYATSGNSIFRMDLSGNRTILRSLESSEGSGPLSALIEASDGSLYGTAYGGGAYGVGTVYELDSTGTFTLLHSFQTDDGALPAAALVQADDGAFYGTTESGGEHGFGTIFRMDSNGAFSVLRHFSGGSEEDPDGEAPKAPLIQASDGNLYGTTTNGGQWFMGTVFGIDLYGGLHWLHSMDEYGESNPLAALVEGTDGNLYGTATGTIFRVGFGGDYTIVSLGAESHADLLSASDGSLYGTTWGGGDFSAGTVFKMSLTGEVTPLHSFNRFDGSNPELGLIQASDGNFYGSTFYGGPFGGQGVIFRITNAAIALNQIIPTSGPAAGGTSMDLIGGGFGPNATVTIGGSSAGDVTVLDPTFVQLLTPALSPGTLNDVSVDVAARGLAPASAVRTNAFFADFVDVPQLDPFHDYVEKIFRNGITAGCFAGSYCPEDAVTRAQMAVFLLKSKHGSSFVPPACNGFFADVPCPSMFADWVEQLAAEGITAGCGGGNYCPDVPVTRAQMSVFLLKSKYGSSYLPPACAGVFGDVACPSLFADWIEQLAAEQVTGGCGGGNFCPDNPNTRAQMSAFLVKTFGM